MDMQASGALADDGDPEAQHACCREVLRMVTLQDSAHPPRSVRAWGCGADETGPASFGGRGGYFAAFGLDDQPPPAILRWMDAHPRQPAVWAEGRPFRVRSGDSPGESPCPVLD